MLEQTIQVRYQLWRAGDKQAKIPDQDIDRLHEHAQSYITFGAFGGAASGTFEFHINDGDGGDRYEGTWTWGAPPEDEKAPTVDSNEARKRGDQIELLEVCAKYSDTKEWKGMFSYPGCGYDLVRMGLAQEDKNITPAGRAALWLLGKGPDQTATKAVYTFSLGDPRGPVAEPKPPTAQVPVVVKEAYKGVSCQCVLTKCRAGPGCPHYNDHCKAHIAHVTAKAPAPERAAHELASGRFYDVVFDDGKGGCATVRVFEGGAWILQPGNTRKYHKDLRRLARLWDDPAAPQWARDRVDRLFGPLKANQRRKPTP